jgi:putative transposase
MEALYSMVGISKQGHYKRIHRQERVAHLSLSILKQAQAMRIEHPRIGCRKLYYELQPQGMGRDKTESLLLSEGFRLKVKRNYKRTTYAGKFKFPNLIQGVELTSIDQLWVSDITYIPTGDKHHLYLTLIQDVYSRKIKGWSLSSDLRAVNTVVKAYKDATREYAKGQLSGLIFHSDKGSQYSSDEMKKMHKITGASPSMGGKAWENAHAESLNGVLKNEYISFEYLNIDFTKAKQLIKGIVEKYNTKRPHGSILRMKPVEFEAYVQLIKPDEKPKVKINY